MSMKLAVAFLSVSFLVGSAAMLKMTNDTGEAIDDLGSAINMLTTEGIRLKLAIAKDTENFAGLNDECAGWVTRPLEQGGYKSEYVARGEKGAFPVFGSEYMKTTYCMTPEQFEEYSKFIQANLANDVWRLEDVADELKESILNRTGEDIEGQKLDFARVLRTRNAVLTLADRLERSHWEARKAIAKATAPAAPQI